MKLVAALVGASPDTVSPGVRELEEGVEPDGRVRRAGAGRPPVEQADPGCGALMLVGIALLGVITASIAAWSVDRLRDVQVAETTTEAALGEVLAELKALHVRLDAIERQPRVVEQAKPSSAPAPLPSQGRQR